MIDEDRSPLKDRPLRTPGQSCLERRQQLFEEKLELPLIAAAASIVLTGLEFWRSYSNSPPMPWAYASIAFAAIGFTAWRVKKYLPELRNLALAADGEKAVGQLLERLRSKGYDVIHDVPAQGFNLDHVLLGPAGIFTVETKTWRKGARGDARLSFDGKTLLRNGHSVDRDPIVQARAQASWLVKQLEASTGRRYLVRPIVLFPGWWIDNKEGAFNDIWVLEPKALPDFLEHEGIRLSTEQIRMASYHLSRYVRTFAVNR